MTNAGRHNAGWRAPLALGIALLLVWAGSGWSDQVSLLTRIEDEVATILENNRPSVVRIHTIYSQGTSEEALQFGKGFMHGTGFVFDPRGYILTVEKAVRGAEEIWVTLASGEQMPAEFIASDPVSEVAVIQVHAEGLKPVSLGNSDRVRIGHYAFIIGNTFGNLTPSFGVAHEIDRTQDLIHITAPVHPSYGGAPVFCSTGAVVGLVWALPPDPWAGMLPEGAPRMVAWQERPTTVFVVPINRALQIARNLLNGARAAYGWLGVEGQYDPEQHGFQVTRVLPNGPAAKSGIHPGDLIIAYQGRSITSGEHLRNLVLSTPPGTAVQMKIKRSEDDRPTTPQVEVGQLPAEPEVFADNDAAGRAQPVSSRPAFGQSNPEFLFQELDRLQQEVWRLRQQLLHRQQPGR